MKAPAGPALRICNFDEAGPPVEVRLTAAEARKLRWLRVQWRGDREYAAWMAPSGAVYLTPTGQVHERSAPAVQEPKRGKPVEAPPPAPRRARPVPKLLL